VARHRLCHARLRSHAAGSNTFLPSLPARPTFYRIVPEAQRAVACNVREAMSERNFFAELKRRNVYKVAVAYAVVAWLLIQAASILFPTYEAPAWVMKVFVAIVALGFPIALVIAWAFEMTPEGMKRTEYVRPDEKIPQ